MKLYASSLVCYGLLGIIMVCPEKAPLVFDGKCRGMAYAVAKIQAAPEAERKALPRWQKQANASIVQKYQKDCKVK